MKKPAKAARTVKLDLANLDAKLDAVTVYRHSEGPFHTVRRFGDNSPIGITNEHNYPIGLVPCDDTIELANGHITEVCSPVAQANADLLAASWDLLKALEGMVRAVSGRGSINLDPHDLGPADVLAAARIAIAKAKGK